ncbi:unnamed protein product, partial [marine sediment metagenome]
MAWFALTDNFAMDGISVADWFIEDLPESTSVANSVGIELS